MAKLKKGELVIETSLPSEIVNLKAQGFVVVDEPAPVVSVGAVLVGEAGPELVNPPKPSSTRK